MSAISASPDRIAEMQKAFIAGVVGRAKVPATKAVKMYPMAAPKPVPVVGGVRAKPTRPTYGHVRISTYPKHFAGLDAMGFMT
jgi:hypothetical protein